MKKDTHMMGEPLVSLSGRFPVSVVARIDAHVEATRRALPGVSFGRSDALRSLVMQALDALESRAEAVPAAPAPQLPPRRRKRVAAAD
jgi:hypothetical protein